MGIRTKTIVFVTLGSAGCLAALAMHLFFGKTPVGFFIFLLAYFSGLSYLYISISGKVQLVRLFDLPVFVTIRVLVGFGFAPLLTFLTSQNPDEDLSSGAVVRATALALVVAGMVAFWAGCLLVQRKPHHSQILLPQKNDQRRILTIALLLYGLGFACKVYLLRAHMWSYTTSFDLYWANLSDAQVFMFGSQFASVALLMLCIEKFSAPGRRLVDWLFWAMFFSECAWGFISGMKSVLLANLISVALISTILRRKLAKTWVTAAVAGMIVLYPLFDSYRAVLRGESAVEVSSFETAARALNLAVADSLRTTPSSSDWLQTGTDNSIARFDLLSSFVNVITLREGASEIHGDERLWMIPFYPFIPRSVWPSKPILDDGARFSEVLGFGRETSTAVTYPADCYIYAGIPGLLIGMFVLGLLAQRFTNAVNGPTSKYQVLKYSVLTLTCFTLETSVFSTWTSILKLLPALFVLGWAAYGRSKPFTFRMVALRALFARGVRATLTSHNSSPFSNNT